MRPLLLLLFLLILTFLTQATSAHACAWDTDTPRDEATLNPDVYKATIGWFDRNPDLYYQMRLDRVSKELATTPANFNLYDDAGVACDRLGKGDDAIAWMARKRTALDKAALPPGPEASEHEYRYLANLGTFHAHRWVKNGADRSNLEDLTKARDLINKAIILNPNAHFGREKVQLVLIDWLIKAPKLEYCLEKTFDGTGYCDPLSFLSYHTSSPDDRPIEPDEQSAKGLAGLVVLGTAWNSFDLYVSLALNEGRNANGWLEMLAWERARELATQKKPGRVSLHPSIDTPDKAAALIPSDNTYGRMNRLTESQHQTIADHFRTARAAADARHEARTAFMLAKLKTGQHPDTHPDFWKGWTDHSPPSPPLTSFYDFLTKYSIHLILALLVSTILILMIRYRNTDPRVLQEPP